MFIYQLFGDNKKFNQIINNLPIYSSDNNLTLFNNFIQELYQDLKYFKYDYEIKQIINDLLIPDNNKYLSKIDYGTFFFGSSFSYSYEENINKVINISDEQIFYNIIRKYSNKKLDPKLLPLDPSVNLKLCDEVFNINIYLINFLLYKNNYLKICSYQRINTMISYLQNDDKYFQQIINNLNLLSNDYRLFSKKFIKQINNKEETLGNYLYNNVIINQLIDMEKIKKENKENYNIICQHIFFKSLLLNNKFVDMKKILSYIYCGSHIHLLNIINILRPELLCLDLNQMYLIFAYGRLKVFNFLFENIPFIIFEILSQSNPLDLNIKFSYYDDIWCDYNWNEDNLDAPIVGGITEHENLIKLLLGLANEHKLTHIKWTDENKKKWIKYALNNKKYKFQRSHEDYFIEYDNLLSLLNLEFNLNDKQSIQTHIDLFGKKLTWEKIKLDCNENFLDLFFDTILENIN